MEVGWSPSYCSLGALLLTHDPFPGSGHLSLTLASNWEEGDGLRFLSPGNSSLKSSSRAWQAYDRCSSPSLTGGPYQPLADQVSQSESCGLSNWIPGSGTSPATICWFARFDRYCQFPCLWAAGLMKKLPVLLCPLLLLPGLCNSWATVSKWKSITMCWS